MPYSDFWRFWEARANLLKTGFSDLFPMFSYEAEHEGQISKFGGIPPANCESHDSHFMSESRALCGDRISPGLCCPIPRIAGRESSEFLQREAQNKKRNRNRIAEIRFRIANPTRNLSTWWEFRPRTKKISPPPPPNPLQTPSRLPAAPPSGRTPPLSPPPLVARYSPFPSSKPNKNK